MTTFRKRVYQPRQLFQDLGFLAANSLNIVRAYRSGLIPWRMAEKIMLATSSVNECTHCIRFHTSLGLASGVEKAEIDDLLSQEIGLQINEFEAPALRFAQYFSETNRHPDPAEVQSLIDFYGEAKFRDIMLFIRLILFGNLGGNTFDAFFSRLRGQAAENSTLLFEFLFMVFALPLVTAAYIFAKVARSQGRA